MPSGALASLLRMSSIPLGRLRDGLIMSQLPQKGPKGFMDAGASRRRGRSVTSRASAAPPTSLFSNVPTVGGSELAVPGPTPSNRQGGVDPDAAVAFVRHLARFPSEK
jgi:hypothetical protein